MGREGGGAGYHAQLHIDLAHHGLQLASSKAWRQHSIKAAKVRINSRRPASYHKVQLGGCDAVLAQPRDICSDNSKEIKVRVLAESGCSGVQTELNKHAWYLPYGTNRHGTRLALAHPPPLTNWDGAHRLAPQVLHRVDGAGQLAHSQRRRQVGAVCRAGQEGRVRLKQGDGTVATGNGPLQPQQSRSSKANPHMC